MKILLVGGAVRNLLLGRPAADKDFLVLDSTRKEFLKKFPQAKEVGHHFPVFLVNGNEYSFLRQDTLDNDLLARDFTVNAMALDSEGNLFAHPLALQDLHARLLRPASSETFKDDPARIFRAARFLAQLEDFHPCDELIQALKDAGREKLASLLPPQRVGAELMSAMNTAQPSRFLDLLARCSCLLPWFAELEDAKSVPAGPSKHHSGSVWDHTLEVMDRLASGGPFRVWLGLVHDLGKCATSPQQWPQHIGHEKAGETLAMAMGERLQLPKRFILAGSLATRWHILAGRYPELRPGTRVDLLTRMKSRAMVENLFALAAADYGTSYGAATDHSSMALADLKIIAKVHLSAHDSNLGEESGKKLRQLKAQAIAQR